MEKITARKRGKKLAIVFQHKNMCIPIFGMHANICNIRKLSNHFNCQIVKFYNEVRVMNFRKGYEFF